MIAAPLPTCPCTCCVEQRNRLGHGRDIGHACSCSSYGPNEQCDCAPCLIWVRS